MKLAINQKFIFIVGRFFLQNCWFFQVFERTVDGLTVSLTLDFLLQHPNLWFSVSEKL